MPENANPSPDGSGAPLTDEARRALEKDARRRVRRRRVRAAMIALVIAVGLGALVFRFCLDIVEVTGGGMSPTIQGGSIVVCARQSFVNELRGFIPESLRHPGRDSLVLVNCRSGDQDPGVLLIRRVTAVGGDTLDVAAGTLILNQDHTVGEAGQTDWVYPVSVPVGELFVTGDCRGAAIDSRLRAFGNVAQGDVAGRPLAVIWPLFAIGILK